MGSRPTVAEIDLEALAFNYQQIEKVVGSCKILSVVKADAYGHGAMEVSKKLEKLGVDLLGVAILQEAQYLRNGGIKSPILILNSIFPGECEEAVRGDFSIVVYCLDTARQICLTAKKLGKKGRIHIKVDTGMGRLGVVYQQWRDFLSKIKEMENLQIEGILTHLADADGEGEDYTLQQLEIFDSALEEAHSLGVNPPLIHAANTAGLFRFPQSRYTLVRPGLGLYGAYPSKWFKDKIQLLPVMTLKTRICQIKKMEGGSAISYGATYKTKRPSLIATLPIGYADGYSRLLSNNSEVLVRGERAPVVGRVTMDMIMIDVTDIEGVEGGDEVVLLGRQGGEQITVEEIAEKIKTISYEVFCSIGNRVPRIYK